MPEVSKKDVMALAVVRADAVVVSPLRKRRSCDLVKTPSPCVRKALFHLERIKELVRIVLKNSVVYSDDLEGRTSSEIYGSDKHPKGWKQLRFDITSRTSRSSLSAESEFSVQADFSLAITGIGGQPKDIENRGDSAQYERRVQVQQLERKNQLPPHEIFRQVRDLVLRLEEDRRVTEEMLHKEIGIVETLSLKIDRMCHRRMLHLPLAVQREHEKCATDISELQWHVAFTERQLDRCKHRVQVAEVLNHRLKDDISFVKKHCPLVEEKLILEKDAMQKIRTMQKQTDSELADAKIELDKTEHKYQDAMEKAEKDRQSTKEKLEGIRGQLRLLKKDYQHSNAMYHAYVKKAQQSKEKLQKQEEELINLQAKAEEAKEKEQEEIYIIDDVRQQVKDVEGETGEVNKQKFRIEEDMEKMHTDMREKINRMETNYRNSLKDLRRLQEENRDMKLDIEDMTDEIKNSDKSLVKSEKEIDRFKKERERCEAQLKEASVEVANITVINAELRTTLDKEENKCQAIEDALRMQAESLRKHVMDEMRQRTLMETKKQQNSNAILKGKSENKKKRKKVVNTLNDTENAVSKIENDVKLLKDQHLKTTQDVAELESKLGTVKGDHERLEKQLTEERDRLRPIEKELLSTQVSLQDKIKEMDFEEEQMTQKLKDMTVSRNSMEKRIITTETSIAETKEELDEFTLQLEAGKITNEELQRQLDEATKRLSDRKKQHSEMMNSRCSVKEKLEKAIEEELIQNKLLAQQYRDLQSQHIDLKNRLMSLYDNKVKMEASIKDHKQLLALQNKFNLALKQYYHDRGEYNKAGLEKFHSEAEDNSNMMVKVQGGLKEALSHISKFLQSQIEGGAADQVHEAAMKHLLDDNAITA